MKTIIAGAFAVLLTAGAGQAQEAGGSCAFGSVTNALLAKGMCTASIPLPTPRPDLTAVSSLKPQAARSDFTYITTHTADGAARQVRLVGPRFLPDQTEEIHLMGKSDQAEVQLAG